MPRLLPLPVTWVLLLFLPTAVWSQGLWDAVSFWRGERRDSNNNGSSSQSNNVNDKQIVRNQETNDTHCLIASEEPNSANRWMAGFPASLKPTAICNGHITLQENGDICVEGRVTFQQIMDHCNCPIWTTSSSTVSINGLLTSGQGSVSMGTQWKYIYDFVTSYRINGTDYTATPGSALEHTFVASYGTVDAYCLDKSIREGPAYYEMDIAVYPRQLQVDASEIQDATTLFISCYALTVEYYRAIDAENAEALDILDGTGGAFGLDAPRLIGDAIEEILDMFGGSDDAPANATSNVAGDNDEDSELSSPGFIAGLPGYFPVLGLLRAVNLPGVYRTSSFVNGLYDGDSIKPSEQIHFETSWKTFLSLVEDGFFQDNKPPLQMFVSIRRMTSDSNSKGCWTEDTAGIVMGAPSRAVDYLEDYADLVHEAIMNRDSRMTLHFGKRVPRNPAIVQTALDTLESCGVTIDLEDPAVRCIHPNCHRRVETASWSWPSEYYNFMAVPV